MSEGTIRRVIEIDAKIGSEALTTLRQLQQAAASSEGSLKNLTGSMKVLADRFGEAKAPGDRFIENLEKQILLFGRSQKAVREYEAALLNVQKAAQPLINELDRLATAQVKNAEVQKQNLALDAAIAASQNARIDRGLAIITNLTLQRDAIGKTAEELQRLEAASLNVLQQYDRLKGEIRQLTLEEARAADAARELARAEDETAAADKRHSEAGQQILVTLREQIALLGQSEAAQLKARNASNGVSVQGDPLVDQLLLRKALLKELDIAEAETVAVQKRAADAEAKRAQDGQQLLAYYRQQIELIGLTKQQQDLKAGEKLGVGTELGNLQTQLNLVTQAYGRVADAAAEATRREREAEVADKAHSDAGQQLLATLRAQTEEYQKQANRTLPVQDVLARADATGVGPQARAQLVDLNAAKAAADAVAAQNAVLAENAAALKRAAQAGADMEASLQRQVDIFHLDAAGVREFDAALNGNLSTVQKLNRQLGDLEETQRRKIAQEREEAAAIAAKNRETDSEISKGKQLLAQLRDTVATQGKSQKEVFDYRINQLQSKGALTGGQAAEAKVLTNQLKEVAAAGHAVGGSLAGTSAFSRELLVLSHELSQGQYKRFGGSLIVLAEIANVGKYAFTALGASVLGATAIVGTFLALAVKGAFEQEAFGRSVQLTGNYAGQTADSFDRMSVRVKNSAGITVGASREILQALIENARIGPTSIEAIGRAASNLSRITGKSADEIGKQFDGITKDTVAWSLKANEAYNFLTPVILANIKSLQEQGKEEEAAVIAADRLSDALGKQKENVGTITSLFRSLKDAISDTKHAIEDLGKTPTPDKLITVAAVALQNVEYSLNRSDIEGRNPTTGKKIGQADGKNDDEARLNALRKVADARSALIKSIRVKDEADLLAARDAEDKFANKNVIEGIQKYIDLTRGLELGNKFLEFRNNYEREYQRIRDNNARLPEGKRLPVVEGSAYEDREKVRQLVAVPGEAIRKADLEAGERRYGNKNDKEAENSITALIKSLEKEKAVLKDQIEQYDLFGDAVNNSAAARVRAALIDNPRKPGEAADADKGRRDEAERLGRQIDALKQEENAKKELSDLAKRIKGIETETVALAANTREREFAALVGRASSEAELTKDPQIIANKEKLLAIAKRSIEARADNKLLLSLKEQNELINQEIKQLETETSLIGLSTIERTKALAVLKLEAQARKDIRDNPGKADVINAVKDEEVKKLTKALQENYDEQRTFEAGAKKAFASYAEDAGNAAKYSEQVIGNSLKGLEDALFSFFKTGKFSLKSFFQGIADDFLRQQSKLLVKKFFDLDTIKDNAVKAFSILKGQYYDPAELKRQAAYLDSLKIDRTGQGIDPNGARDIAVDGGKSFRQMELEYANSKDAEIKEIAKVDPVKDLLAKAEANLRVETDALSRAFNGLRVALESRKDTEPASTPNTDFSKDTVGKSEYDPSTPSLIPNRERRSNGKPGSAFFTAAEIAVPDSRPIPVRLVNADEFAKLNAQESKVLQGVKDPAEQSEIRALYQRERDFAKRTGSFEPGFNQDSGGGGLQVVNPFTSNKKPDFGINADAIDTLRKFEREQAKGTQELTSFSTEGLVPASTALDVLTTSSSGTATGFDTLIASAQALALALDAAAAAASAKGAASGVGSSGGALEELATVFAANGGIVSGSIGLHAFANGGLMSTPFGNLKPEHYSEGGITSRARLAVFGEGRKPEAYIPLEDGKTVPVQVDGQDRAYVPLPGGRRIPVTMKGGGQGSATGFADGGVMSYGFTGFADGGIFSALAGLAPTPAELAVPKANITALVNSVKSLASNVFDSVTKAVESVKADPISSFKEGATQFAQGVSNSAASTISGPVDLLNLGLQKVGLGSAEPTGGSAQLARLGLTKPATGVSGYIGERVGDVLPIVAQARAPQIASAAISAQQFAKDGAFAFGQKAADGLEQYLAKTGGLQSAVAYHGSPYTFDKFDSAKIGTGEGAQAYGRGLYFAEEKAVAEGYKETLGKFEVLVNGKPVRPELNSPAQQAKDYTEFVSGKDPKFPDPFGNASKRVSFDMGEGLVKSAEAEGIAKVLQEWKESGASIQKPGAVYKVEIPDDQIAKMLDYDKPLKSQPNVLKGIDQKYDPEVFLQQVGSSLEDTGGELLQKLGSVRDATKAQAVADTLKNDFGIPGVKYLDRGSRGASEGSGTSNFVVFDDKMIKILERNGEDMTKAAQSFSEAKLPVGETSAASFDDFLKASKADTSVQGAALNEIKTFLGDVPGVLKDAEGKGVIAFRGSHGGDYDPAAGRPDYAAFTSDNPYVASSFASGGFKGPVAPEVGNGASVTPFVFRDNVDLKEFPVKSNGGFDKFAFDEQAKRLGDNQVLVARNSVDTGPNGGFDYPFNRDTYPSNQYAFKDPSVVRPLTDFTAGAGQSKLSFEQATAGFKDNVTQVLEKNLAKLTRPFDTSQRLNTFELSNTTGGTRFQDFTQNGAAVEAERVQKQLDSLKADRFGPQSDASQFDDSLETTVASVKNLSAAFETAAAAFSQIRAPSSASSIPSSSGSGDFSDLFAAYAANGGVMSHSGGLTAFASGGLMSTPFGNLKPEHYSDGGITNTARLAVFGEGRKPEAYVPLEDGKTIPVSVGKDNKAYVPLPGGRKIPVTMSAFADGGVMSYAAYATGGIAPYYNSGTAGFASSGNAASGSAAGSSNASDTTLKDLTQILKLLLPILAVDKAVNKKPGDTSSLGEGFVKGGLKLGLSQAGPAGQLASLLVDPLFKAVKEFKPKDIGLTGEANVNDVSSIRKLDNKIAEQTASLEKIANAPSISGSADNLPGPFTSNAGFPETSFRSQGIGGDSLVSDTLAQADAAQQTAGALKGLADDGIGSAADSLDLFSFASNDSTQGLAKTASSALESSLGMGTAASSALSLSGALQTAAVSASSGSAGSGLGGLGSLFGGSGGAAGGAEAFIDYGLFVEKGGVISHAAYYETGGVHRGPNNAIKMYAEGGYADTPFGRLKQERESDGGGIARNARLAVFGEGRLPEAYIPMTDGKSVGIQVDRNGESYVPLSGGRKIPVSIKGEGFDPARKKRARSFGYGGTSEEVQYFAEGGVGGGMSFYSQGGTAGFDAAGATNNALPDSNKGSSGGKEAPVTKQAISIDYSPTIQIDSRSDQAQIAQLVQASVSQGQRQLLQHLKDTGAIQ